MKTLWTAISIFAVANLLALGGLLGWLHTSDRLNVDRVRELRMMMSKTLSSEKAEADSKVSEAAAAKVKAEAEAKASQPPLSAQERLDARLEATELDRQRAQRLRREIEDLRNELDRQRAEIDTARIDLTQREKAFEQLVNRQKEAVEGEQFQRALGVLSALKPVEATAVLMQIMQRGQPAPTGVPGQAGTQPASTLPAANVPASIANQAAAASGVAELSGVDTAVTYLNAMDERPRGRIMTELAKADPALAADLLERVRALGQFAQVPGAQP